MPDGNAASALIIKADDLGKNPLEAARRCLREVGWTAVAEDKPATAPPSIRRLRVATSSIPQTEKVSLIDFAKAFEPKSLIGKEATLFSETLTKVLKSVELGLAIGVHLGNELYRKAVGLDQLERLNSRGQLGDSQKEEFRNKYYTDSAIQVFTSSYYIVWQLMRYRSEEVTSINMDFPGLPEIALDNPVYALDALIFYYVKFLQRSQQEGKIKTDLDLVKATLLYFQAVIDSIKLRSSQLKYAELFTGNHYKLENEEFSVHGFETSFTGLVTSVQFRRVKWDEIVGNMLAKHRARRKIQRLLSYCFKEKKNPMYVLGALPDIEMGYGPPGTGKSLQIAASVTYANDLAEWLGYPFLFHPLPDDIISTFQGGSAERGVVYMKVFMDPTKIIIGSIDDGEVNLINRTLQGVSGGVREWLGVYLRYTEGAYAIRFGNVIIEIYTNIPDQIDPAVLSRTQGKFIIDGATNWKHFVDQDHGWWRQFRDLDPAFVNMSDPIGYKYMEAETVQGVQNVYLEGIEPKDERLKTILEQVGKQADPQNHKYFGLLFEAVKAVFPGFTSRDVRNIQKAVTSRVYDFDYPSEWLEREATFFHQPYDAKMNMIGELARASMGGLSFADIRYQEAIRYFNAMIEIAETEVQREVEREAKRIFIAAQANAKAQEMLRKRMAPTA